MKTANTNTKYNKEEHSLMPVPSPVHWWIIEIQTYPRDVTTKIFYFP